MTSPGFIDFLKLVSTDVKILKLWAFEGRELWELVLRNIKPNEIREKIILTEDSHVLNSVV